MADPIIIVGTGQAGAALSAKLRVLGYSDPLVMIGEEPVLPYQRPPLSKKYASGELQFERLLIRPPGWYAEQQVEVRLGASVASLDPMDRTVKLDDGSVLRYAKLALTTGSRPRLLPAELSGNLGGVFTTRTVADVDAIAPLLVPGKRLLVIGGGYIGLEAAAVAATRGLKVTIVELADRILQRVAASATADYFRALHRRHGVTILESAALDRLVGDNGQVAGAALKDGRTLEADLAIVGIGIIPNDELARRAGLVVDDGIIVDGLCRTSAPEIYAAGDCARFPWRGVSTRLESVQNAIDQAEHVAAAMLGAQSDYDPVPWFWSDQYEVKLQIAGLNRGYTDCILRTGKREGSASIWYYRGDALIAVDAMNDALSYGIAKKLLEAGRTVPKAAVADPGTETRALLSA
ncbi:NAD(P)/FAD-dependent oxidoreductase [Dongia deserti]|uniref:NAD(P)/FAD-dependent oxidoreductase n=1 Tax=Dongia deserti TaxID=2268030 RepID=UPI000E6584A7|nr:FAD-dependent oxidoreductase [Dongia deserti]